MATQQNSSMQLTKKQGTTNYIFTTYRVSSITAT